MDIYRNKLVNRIETKPLCVSSSNLANVNHGERMKFISFGGHK